MSATGAIDPLSERGDLSHRLELAIQNLLSERLPSDADVRTFLNRVEPEILEMPDGEHQMNLKRPPVGKNWFQVIARPESILSIGTSGWMMGVMVTAHGELEPGLIDDIDVLFSNPQALTCELRTVAAEFGFVLPLGRSIVDFSGGTGVEKSGLVLDSEMKWTFSIPAQAAEIAAVAA